MLSNCTYFWEFNAVQSAFPDEISMSINKITSNTEMANQEILTCSDKKGKKKCKVMKNKGPSTYDIRFLGR